MSKWYQADLFKKYPTDEKTIQRKEPPCRFLLILVLLAAERKWKNLGIIKDSLFFRICF